MKRLAVAIIILLVAAATGVAADCASQTRYASRPTAPSDVTVVAYPVLELPALEGIPASEGIYVVSLDDRTGCEFRPHVVATVARALAKVALKGIAMLIQQVV